MTNLANASAVIRRACGSRMAMVVAILVILGGQSLVGHFALAEQSPTFAEPDQLAQGFFAWRAHDYRLAPQGGLLPQLWATLPLAFGNNKLNDATWHRQAGAAEPPQARKLLYRSGNDPDRLFRSARLMMLLLNAALALALWGWSRELWGGRGALFTLFLYAVSPTILARAGMVADDLPLALALIMALWTLWRMHQIISPLRVAAATAALAALFLMGTTAPMILPVALALLLLRTFSPQPLPIRGCGSRNRDLTTPRHRLAALATVTVIQILVVTAAIWTAYGGHATVSPDCSPTARTAVAQQWSQELGQAGATAFPLAILRRAHALPEAWLLGQVRALAQGTGQPTFVHGHCRTTGWWFFLPYSLLIKSPLPLLLCAALLLLLGLHHPPPGWRTNPAWLPPAIFLATYFTIAVVGRLNLDQRHLLPALLLLFLAAGRLPAWFATTRLRQVGGLLLVAWMILETCASHPHYLAYFNRLAGGPSQGWQRLTDSALDLGQDLPRLRQLAAARPHGQRLYLAYFGTADLDHYQLDELRLPGLPPQPREQLHRLEPGRYAISATMLQLARNPELARWNPALETRFRYLHQLFIPLLRAAAMNEPANFTAIFARRPKAAWQNDYRAYEWLRFARLCSHLRQRQPDGQLGYSILWYDISRQELNRALHDEIP